MTCEPLFAQLSDVDATRIDSMFVGDDGRSLSRLPARQFSRLRLADVSIINNYNPHALDFLNYAPALRDLTISLLYDCTDDEVLHGFPIPRSPMFPHLTHLYLCFYNFFPISAFIETISRYAPSLREIATETSINAGWEETRPSAIFEMPALRTANLNYYTHRLLAYITAPVLDSVTFHTHIYSDTDPTDSLLEFLSRSPKPSLRTVSLTDPLRGTADTLERCLERMEGMCELRVRDIGYDATSAPRVVAMLRLLVCEEDKAPVLPELKVFSLEVSDANAPFIDSEIKPPLSLMRWSRRETRICAGCTVVALEKFETNVDISVTMS